MFQYDLENRLFDDGEREFSAVFFDWPGDLAGSATLGITASGTLTGAGALAGSVGLSLTPPTAVLGGVGALAGSAAVGIVPDALLLKGTGALAGAATAGIAPAGALTASGALAGSATVGISPAAALTATGALAGNATGTVAPTGALTGTGALAGSATAGVTPTGVLTGRGSLSGTASVGVVGHGDLVGVAPALVRVHHSPLTEVVVHHAPQTEITARPDMSFYNIGDTAIVKFELRVDNVLTNATAVVVTVKPEGVASSTPAVVHTGTGKYEVEIDCTSAGVWRGRMVSTGAAKGAEAFVFTVKPNEF